MMTHWKDLKISDGNGWEVKPESVVDELVHYMLDGYAPQLFIDVEPGQIDWSGMTPRFSPTKDEIGQDAKKFKLRAERMHQWARWANEVPLTEAARALASELEIDGRWARQYARRIVECLNVCSTPWVEKGPVLWIFGAHLRHGYLLAIGEARSHDPEN